MLGETTPTHSAFRDTGIWPPGTFGSMIISRTELNGLLLYLQLY